MSAAGAPDSEKKVADFLSRVVPWPQPDTPGFINVHWTFPSHKGMGGKPFTDLPDALSFIEWAKSHPEAVKDLYYCLSLQAKSGPMRKGKPTALRRAANAVALKAIWLDIDCNKEPPKGYRSKEDGVIALKEFLRGYQNAVSNRNHRLGKWAPRLLDFRQTAIPQGVASVRGGIRCTSRTARIIPRFDHHGCRAHPPDPWDLKQQAGPAQAGKNSAVRGGSFVRISIESLAESDRGRTRARRRCSSSWKR